MISSSLELGPSDIVLLFSSGSVSVRQQPALCGNGVAIQARPDLHHGPARKLSQMYFRTRFVEFSKLGFCDSSTPSSSFTGLSLPRSICRSVVPLLYCLPFRLCCCLRHSIAVGSIAYRRAVPRSVVVSFHPFVVVVSPLLLPSPSLSSPSFLPAAVVVSSLSSFPSLCSSILPSLCRCVVVVSSPSPCCRHRLCVVHGSSLRRCRHCCVVVSSLCRSSLCRCVVVAVVRRSPSVVASLCRCVVASLCRCVVASLCRCVIRRSSFAICRCVVCVVCVVVGVCLSAYS